MNNIITTDKSHYNNIAKKIQQYTDENTKYKPEDMAEGVEAVYNAGEWENWKKFQDYGNRVFYPYAFSHNSFPHIKILQLPYAIYGTGIQGQGYATNGGNSMFRQNNIIEQILTDIVITSGAQYVFQSCGKLWKIQNIVVDKAQVFSNWFADCIALSDIRWGNDDIGHSEIGQTLDLGVCPLDKLSIKDTVNHLSSSVTGKTLTLKKSAVDTAFETVQGANDGSTSAEWIALKASVSNWTITLKN